MTPDEIIEVLQGFKAGRGWQFLSTASEWKTPILSSLDSMLHALYSGQTIRLAPLPDEITIPARVIPAPLREEQAENARLCAEKHLAALNHTEGKKKIDDAVDKAWGRFCAAMPDDQSPYPGMAKAFEVHYGVSWTDRDWRNEQSTWAAAWRMAWDRRATVLDAEQDAARLALEVHLIISIECVSGMDDVVEQ